ncbi:MAG: hypothetical protein DRJ38_01790 [Thermoprotei archaeon]|nr:MAG: hypothetical protein DRJ38_01790 [Thermoprotei archaeon]
MPKVKIEDILPSGEKVSVVIEGSEVSRERILQILDLFNILSKTDTVREPRTLKEKIWEILVNNFSDGEWFTINEAYAAVRQSLRDVSVTAVSSYVSRFLREGRLEKTGRKPRTRYRIKKTFVRVF